MRGTLNGFGGVCGAVLLAAVLCMLTLAPSAGAQPVELAAPYEYLGWGEPPPPASVITKTGIHDLTLAFMLSSGGCNPAWDGGRPLLGGSDQAAIASIRAAGGDVAVSFGGWNGKKLGTACGTASKLAGAYQKVIDAYSLKAIDIDIENKELSKQRTRARVVAALKLVQAANPGLEISVTMGSNEEALEANEQSLIGEAAAIGFQPTVWTVMPFNFGVPRTDMGDASIRALENLERDIVSVYHLSAAAAWEHVGISSMNGHTDEASEIVGFSDWEKILAFAATQHLGRVSFWSVNRDRSCGPAKECSGIAQSPLAFTTLLAAYHG